MRVGSSAWIGMAARVNAAHGSRATRMGITRLHPPHSQAHRAFTARRLIRDAFAVRERRGDGTNSRASSPTVASGGCRACRYQPNNSCDDSPWRRATALADSPLVRLSATIRALSSVLQVHQRPVPVNTSIRRSGSVIAVCSVSKLSLTVQIRPQTHRTSIDAKGGAKTPLSM